MTTVKFCQYDDILMATEILHLISNATEQTTTWVSSQDFGLNNIFSVHFYNLLQTFVRESHDYIFYIRIVTMVTFSNFA